MSDADDAALNYIEGERRSRSGTLIFFGQAIQTLPAAIRDLTHLTTLLCSESPLRTLQNIETLNNLQRLELRYTKVSDLAPLSKLNNLRELDISNSSVQSLEPLRHLPNLEIVHANDCVIKDDVEWICDHPRLTCLSLSAGRLGSAPVELLDGDGTACLERLRAYYRSLRSGVELTNSAKIFLYGNGEVGKTQLARSLDPSTQGPAYDPRIMTTHGVQIRQFIYPPPTAAEGDLSQPLKLRLWDFGGQDLYHGAHALFLGERAIHLIAWTPDSESGRRRDSFGYLTVNHPISYWITFARNVQAQNNALIVAQTQADSSSEVVKLSRAQRNEFGHGFGRFAFLATSAKTGAGIEQLKAEVRDSSTWLVECFGQTRIARSWARVETELERIKALDAARVRENRENRVMERAAFDQLASSLGVAEDHETLLYYLSAIGAIYWHPKRFTGRLILDQGWTLDAIYALFDRGSCVSRLRAAGGRFVARDIGEWLWDDLGHSRDDQSLFLSFMLSCHICFEYNEMGERTIYLAPDALPKVAVVDPVLQLGWDPAWVCKNIVYQYELLHDGLIRGLMSTLGKYAGTDAIYWRDGLQLYDLDTKCRLRLWQERREGWAGQLHVAVQHDPDSDEAAPNRLLSRIARLIADQEETNNLHSTKTIEGELAELTRGSGAMEQAATPGPDPAAKRGYFISYAWGDESEEGKARSTAVDDFCTEASRRGIAVNIDKNELRLGDSINAYMDRLTQGDRIFVFLSARYLLSVNCMNELISAWRYSRRDWVQFSARVKVYLLPCARIFSQQDRLAIKQHWKSVWISIKKQHEAIDEDIMAKYDAPERIEIDRLGSIYADCFDVVRQIADHLQAPNFERFCETWLRDLEQ